MLQREDLVGAGREELDRMVRGAVASSAGVAISQPERPGVSVGEQTYERRARPLSAGANYYLAARTVAAVPFVDSGVAVRRLRDRPVKLLGAVEEQTGGETQHRVRSVATGWRSALASDHGFAPGDTRKLGSGQG